jgi:hypothetical protein
MKEENNSQRDPKNQQGDGLQGIQKSHGYSLRVSRTLVNPRIVAEKYFAHGYRGAGKESVTIFIED